MDWRQPRSNPTGRAWVCRHLRCQRHAGISLPCPAGALNRIRGQPLNMQAATSHSCRLFADLDGQVPGVVVFRKPAAEVGGQRFGILRVELQRVLPGAQGVVQ